MQPKCPQIRKYIECFIHREYIYIYDNEQTYLELVNKEDEKAA